MQHGGGAGGGQRQPAGHGPGGERAKRHGRRGTQQAVHARRDLAAISQKRGGERRRRQSPSHAGDAHQRGGEGKRQVGVAGRCVVIGGPFGEARPAAFDGVEAVEAGQQAGRQQQQQALQIVARNPVRFLVAEGGGQLSRR